MSIFDFLFARAATPEQAQKNIFLDAIDGGGRFASFRDVADDDPNKFRGGPLGISALLNALGVDPYGSTDAQPQGQSFAPRPPTGPARSLRPQLRPTPNLVDFIAANTGLRPSTDAELTAAFDQPVPPSLIGRPFDGAGFGYTAPTRSPPPLTFDCHDDTFALASNFGGYTAILNNATCDTELHALSPVFPTGHKVADYCARSCATGDTNDPIGIVNLFGGCAMTKQFLNNDCDAPGSESLPRVPPQGPADRSVDVHREIDPVP